MKNGFVLAELLIVLAIIAILAIVAIPNFLEAETRSNVARAKSGLRTVATALEAYALENNKKYPSDAGNGSGGTSGPTGTGIYRSYANPPHTIADPPASFTIGYEITTPVAYVSTVAALRDPFRWWFSATPTIRGRENFALMNVDLREEHSFNPPGLAITRSRVGSWVLFSAGPDTFFNNRPGGGDYSNFANIPRLRNYDPTNGIVSNGDIYRSHAHADGAPEVGTNQ